VSGFVCTTCSEDFASLAAFDRHRVGEYPQRGPAESVGPLDEWTPERGRRCLGVNEMLDTGFERNAYGRWSIARDLARARERATGGSLGRPARPQPDSGEGVAE